MLIAHFHSSYGPDKTLYGPDKVPIWTLYMGQIKIDMGQIKLFISGYIWPIFYLAIYGIYIWARYGMPYLGHIWILYLGHIWDFSKGIQLFKFFLLWFLQLQMVSLHVLTSLWACSAQFRVMLVQRLLSWVAQSGPDCRQGTKWVGDPVGQPNRAQRAAPKRQCYLGQCTM